MNKQFRLWPMSNTVVRQAVPVIEQHRLRAADAIHLASALAIAARAAPATVVMVTGDQELIRAARSTGLIVLDPTDAGALAQLRAARAKP